MRRAGWQLSCRTTVHLGTRNLLDGIRKRSDDRTAHNFGKGSQALYFSGPEADGRFRAVRQGVPAAIAYFAVLSLDFDT